MNQKNKLAALLLALCFVLSLTLNDTSVTALKINAHETTEEFVLPDIVDSVEAEEKGYTERLKSKETDLSTFVFKNKDGTNTMRVFSHPVKYVAENGEIKDISLDIKANRNGGYITANHEIITTFKNKLTEGISLEYNDVQVKLIPLFSANTTPVAELCDNGKTVTYDVDDATSFVYGLTYAGFKEDIVVEEYTGQTEYSFTLLTNGLSLCEEYGSYYLANGSGNVEACIGDIIVFTADERNNTVGSMTYETVRADEEYILTIHLDADYLADEKTVYPIRIDPTVEINYDNNGSGAIEDVTINERATFSGISGSLYVGRHPAGSLSRSLMRFPNLNLDNISSGYYITAATVEIRDLMCQGDEDITVDCHIYNKASPSWSESGTTTWSSVGSAYLGTLLDSHLISYGQGNVENHRYSFNILSAAQAWADGSESPAKGLVFKACSEFENQTGTNVKTWYKTFAAYNCSSYRPSLSITYGNGIGLTHSSLKVNVGETKQLATTMIYGYTPTNYTLRWQSYNGRIATVDATTGLLQAKAPRKITIKVYFLEEPSVYSKITLTVNPATTQTSSITSGCIYMIKNVSKGKYLSAASSTQVTVATKDAYDGKQLWYVEWTGSGYRLYSLGIKDTSSYGKNETALCGGNTSKSPSVKANFSSYNKWNISYKSSNGYYYLTNTSYNNTSLSANSTDDNIKHISLSSENNYARWAFEKITTSTFNNYYPGVYNGQGTHIYIKVYAETSLYVNNYVDSANMDAVNVWNGLSSNVTIYDLDDAVPSSIKTLSITYKGYSGGKNYGYTQGYKKKGSEYEKVNLNENFDKVDIFINTNNQGPFATQTDDEVVEKVIAHEMGHALKLAHPMESSALQSVTNARNGYPDNYSVLANMNQNSPTDSANLTCLSPKWHDIINLRNKWGV